MKNSLPSLYAIIASFALITSCAATQNNNGGGTIPDRSESGDYPERILGRWKIVAVHCDSQGGNCEWYNGQRVFHFSRNGDLAVNDVRRGTYRLEGPVCILDTGNKRYRVNIIRLDPNKLITGESHRATTEIYNKLK